MHIAFFNRAYYPDGSATAQILAELCESLVQDYGHRVSVIAGPPQILDSNTIDPFRGGQVFRREKHRGVEILRARSTNLPKRKFIGRFSNYITYFLSACWAGIRLQKPDVIVALTDPPIIGLAARLASIRFGCPFVMWYQDIFPEVARLMEDFQSPAVNRVLQSINCYLARSSARCVTLGETMTRRLIETKGADPSKTVVIPPWADCDLIQPDQKKNPFSVANGISENFIVMHSGNIGLSQGLEVVVDSARYLKPQPQIRMVFVGDGVKKKDLEAQVRSAGLENVLFLPYAPKDRLRESFATADVFIVSLKPGLAGFIVPSKLYGILAAGRPFVASVEEESEVAFIARKFECGLLAKPGDPKDLADKIFLLYADPEMRQRFGNNARKAAIQFDRKTQVEAYDVLLKKVRAATS